MRNRLLFISNAYVPECNAIVDKHFDGYYSLQLSVNGNVHLSYDTTKYEITPGTFWPAFPGPHIKFSPVTKQWSHYYVSFKGALVQDWLTEGLFFLEPVSIKNWEVTVPIFQEIHFWLKQKSHFASLKAENKLELLLLTIAENRLNRPEENLWLKNIMEQLHEMFPNGQYEKLAKQNGLALSSFRRKFKNASGISIHQFLIQEKLSKAKQLIQESNYPLKTIAEKCGYNDIFQFTKQFKSFYGTPPAAFRASRQS